mmetsp:Transcript_9087/g.16632  ORF Transcript_9087/g.16632 Transcript_9087/m.16632 type:complete len:166 (+) Transcript_9087:33-530(+)
MRVSGLCDLHILRPSAKSACQLTFQLRFSKIAAKQTHQRVERPHAKPDAHKLEIINAGKIPQYDLGDLPEEFESLRRNKHSQVQTWIAAITHTIGDKNVVHPTKLQDKEHFQIKYHGMVYLLYAPSKHKQDGYELSSHQKKTLLNVLAHMGVFGDREVKLESDVE